MGLPNLEALVIYGEKFTGSGLQQLQGLPSLSSLHTGGANLTDDQLVHLEKLTSLSTLALGEGVTDAGLVHSAPSRVLHCRRKEQVGSHVGRL